MTWDGMFVVKNLRVVNGAKGCFVAMPQERFTDRDGNQKFRDTFFPMNDKARAALEAAVLSAYDVEMYEHPPDWAVRSENMGSMSF